MQAVASYRPVLRVSNKKKLFSNRTFVCGPRDRMSLSYYLFVWYAMLNFPQSNLWGWPQGQDAPKSSFGDLLVPCMFGGCCPGTGRTPFGFRVVLVRCIFSYFCLLVVVSLSFRIMVVCVFCRVSWFQFRFVLCCSIYLRAC